MKKTIRRIAFLILFVSLAFGTTVGPTLVGTGAQSGANTAWVNPGNITAADGVFATCVLGGAGITNLLQGTMGANAFSVPVGSTILGIQVDVSLLDTNANETTWTHAQILKAGTAAGTDQSTGAFVPAVQTTVTFGGAANLWGTTWTATDVNDSNFGFQASFTDILGNPNTVSVDWYKLTVTFTLPASGGMGRRVIRTQTRTFRQQRAV